MLLLISYYSFFLWYILADYPQPRFVVNVDSRISQLKFIWNKPSTQCSSLGYIITTTNCGLCPNTTTDTYITCVLVNITSVSVCTFSVQAEICGKLVGNMSEGVRVTLSPQQSGKPLL